MYEPGKELENASFQTALQVNSQIIEYLSYSLIKIITNIKPFIFIKCKIQLNLLLTKLKVPTNQRIFLLI